MTVTENMVSFLINALYLVGNHRILAAGPVDAEIIEALTGFGQRVDLERSVPARSNVRERYDRVFSLTTTLGYGSEAEDLAWIRAMSKRLSPGGLLGFQVLDRDRAWDIVEEPLLAGAGWDPQGKIHFDPGSGRISARALQVGKIDGDIQSSRARISVRAYNLLEIRKVLAAAGLLLERAYGDWEGRSPEEAGARTGRLIVVASKKRRMRRG